MAAFTEELDRLVQYMSREDLGLPAGEEERYLWVRECSKTMNAIQKAAYDAAWEVYLEVMGSQDAMTLVDELKERMPKHAVDDVHQKG
jgi:hypothetical protein